MMRFIGGVLIIIAVNTIADTQGFWWRCGAATVLLCGLHLFTTEQRK